MKQLFIAIFLLSTCIAQDSSPAQPQQEASVRTLPSSDVGKQPTESSTGAYPGGVYKIGGSVSAPRVIHNVDPKYSKEARKAKYQGTVMLALIVGPDGLPRDIKVSRALGHGLDEKAVEAIRKWRFQPAMKDGKPVAVQINVEVNFHLY